MSVETVEVPMITPGDDVQVVHYQTIEQKRAALHRALIEHPGDKELRKRLLQLTTPSQIRQASKDGVFINYSRDDEVFAIDLSTDLRLHSVKTWLDMVDVPVGGDWRSEIGAALAHSGLMLMIVSRQSLRDRDLKAERRYFIHRGKIILPVVYRPEQRHLDMYVTPIDFRYSYTLGLQNLLRMMRTASKGVLST